MKEENKTKREIDALYRHETQLLLYERSSRQQKGNKEHGCTAVGSGSGGIDRRFRDSIEFARAVFESLYSPP